MLSVMYMRGGGATKFSGTTKFLNVYESSDYEMELGQVCISEVRCEKDAGREKHDRGERHGH